jgi:hypothetical protein
MDNARSKKLIKAFSSNTRFLYITYMYIHTMIQPIVFSNINMIWTPETHHIGNLPRRVAIRFSVIHLCHGLSSRFWKKKLEIKFHNSNQFKHKIAKFTLCEKNKMKVIFLYILDKFAPEEIHIMASFSV